MRDRLTCRTNATWPALLLTLIGAVGACRSDLPKPNVILISIDCLNQRQFEEALRQGDVPALQTLASRSLTFTRAYAHAPWTTPSHMSMLSGLYPSQHGRDVSVLLAGRFGDVAERVPHYETIADRLGGAGYETVAFVGKGSISAKFGLGQGFSAYNEFDQENASKSDLSGSMPALEDWLDRRTAGPFFLFLHTYDFHYPLPESRPTTAAALGHVDAFIGRLMSRLEAGGLYDSTLLIVTSDHGSSMIRTEGKCCVHGAGHYDENLRVPLVVKLPGAAKAARSGAVVRHVDILPTVLAVTGQPRGSYAGPGLPVLSDGETAGDLISYSEADARCVLRSAVVGRRYKYVYTSQDPVAQALRLTEFFFDPLCAKAPACFKVPLEELYDLDADPFEERNLLSSPLTPQARDALETLHAALERERNLPRSYRFAALRGETAGPAPTAEIDEGVKEALRALGYIE
jgi:arylsulfatase A-like enzyme